MGFIDSSKFVNAKFYYGVVLAVYTNDTADVGLYSVIEPYEPGRKYLKGDLVLLPDNKVYKMLATVTLQANNKTFIDHPEYFLEYTPKYYNINISNPTKEIINVIYGCGILLGNNTNSVINGETIYGSHKILVVGTPVIVVKLDGFNSFSIISFDKPDKILVDNGLTSEVGYNGSPDYDFSFICWKAKSPKYKNIGAVVQGNTYSLGEGNIDVFYLYNSNDNTVYKEGKDYYINRKDGLITIPIGSGISNNTSVYGYYVVNSGLRYPIAFNINGSSVELVKEYNDFYSNMSDFWFLRIFLISGSNIVDKSIVQNTKVSYFYQNFIDDNISNINNSAFTSGASLISLNYSDYGKYLYSFQNYYPFNISLPLSIDQIVLCSFDFFIVDSVTQYKYYVRGVVYNNRWMFINYVQVDNNYPLNGSFFHNAFDLIKKAYYNLGSILPDYLSFNYTMNVGTLVEYSGDSCSKFSLFFGLIDFYPTMSDGDFNLSYAYYGVDGVWSGDSFCGSAVINISDNGETLPYLKRYDNTYNFFGREIKEYYDTDENGTGLYHKYNSWRLFRFNRRTIHLNFDGSMPSQSVIDYTQGDSHFPYSLRKLVYKVEVVEKTNILNIDNFSSDLLEQGNILFDWTNPKMSYINITSKAGTYTKIDDTTIEIDRELEAGTYIVSFYLLYFLDEVVAQLDYFEYNNRYYLIEVASSVSKTCVFNDGVFSLLYFIKNNSFINTEILYSYVYYLKNNTVYNIKDSLDNIVGSDYNNIASIAYFNTGLLTNFIEK